MPEPIARAIVRELERELAEWGIFLNERRRGEIDEVRDRLVHVVDAGIKRGVLRLLEEPDQPLERVLHAIEKHPALPHKEPERGLWNSAKLREFVRQSAAE